MEWSKLKTVILLMLAGVNLFLLGLVGVRVTQGAFYEDETRQAVVQVLERAEGSALTVLDASRLLPDGAEAARCFHGSFEPRVEELFREMVRRNNTYKTAKNEGKPLPTFGEQIYLITGLQLILDSLSDAGRDQLVTLLEKGEPEYGIRVVLCDSVKGLSGCAGSAWYRRQVSGTDGVWVGDGISDQYALKVGKVSSSLYADLPPHFGYVVRRGRPVLCKLLQPQEGEDGK